VINGRYQPNVQPKSDSDKDASERSLSKFNATSPRTMNRIERKIGVKVTHGYKRQGNQRQLTRCQRLPKYYYQCALVKSMC